MWFRPPTPPTLSLEGDSSNSKAKLPLAVSISFMWDIEDMYDASKGLCQFSGVIGTTKLDDFIRDFDTLCDMQQLWNP